ncbi:alpha/beta fold hydrolase [Mycobacterium sp. 050134]|uniref:alpha/beta fold hydrolase n=1 Tax=Mycobacterium sp. 050134 TaxID=3096111 RepID=UPI002ED9914D
MTLRELAFELKGSGPGLVLIHGTGSTPAGTWGSCVDELAKSHTVVLPYLPGSGDSPLPAGPLAADAVAEQIVAVTARAGLPRFAVAGASLGGPIAMKVAATYPDRVTHLVSVCGYAKARASLRIREQVFEAVLGLDATTIGRLLLIFGLTETTLSTLPGDALTGLAARLGSNLAPGTREQIVLAYTIDVEKDLESITAPTLLIAGGDDNFVAPSHSERAAQRIAGATLRPMDGGHGLQLESSAQVVAAITAFLAHH